jgi:hypothetical protein
MPLLPDTITRESLAGILPIPDRAHSVRFDIRREHTVTDPMRGLTTDVTVVRCDWTYAAQRFGGADTDAHGHIVEIAYGGDGADDPYTEQWTSIGGRDADIRTFADLLARGALPQQTPSSRL